MIALADIKLNNENNPHYVQIYDYFKNEIIEGKLKENMRLPSIRKLSEFLGISTTPVESAYDQLQAEGFIISRPGSGYYVQKIRDIIYNDISSILYDNEKILPRSMKFEFDFHLSKNDFNYFPFNTWKRLYCQELNIDNKELLFFGDPQGEEGLRKEIANYLRKYRGVACSPKQIIVGADQYELAAILSLLLSRFSQNLAVENPSYPLIPETFRKNGYIIHPIELEADGININELYNSGAEIAFVTPSHQFPKGMIMPISKRLELLNWAKAVKGYIVEDDYDGEFRYHGRPVPSLQGLIPGSNVIYIGGFSQVLAPAICIYYMVLPEALIEGYTEIKYDILLEQASSRLHQRALQLFMEKGYLEKHLRKMKLVYRKKHDIACSSLKRYFDGKINILGTDAGFHLFLEIEHEKSEEELKAIAESAGIRISPAEGNWLTRVKRSKREFVLGFAGIEEEKIEKGIKLLSSLWL